MTTEHTSLTDLFTDIAESIRGKTGSTEPIVADQFPEAIDAIETGITPTGMTNITQNGTYDVTNYASANVNVSGSEDPDYGTVTFLDMDGTVLYTYTRAEALALSALPANAVHAGFTSQGWNMSLAQIQSDLTNYEHQDICVGSLYVTSDGKTRLYISPNDETIHIRLNSLYSTEIDWGDGSEIQTKAVGTSVVTHTYPDTVDRVITLTFPTPNSSLGDASYSLFQTTASSLNMNTSFPAASILKAVEIGHNINAINRGLLVGSMVRYINVPSEVTSNKATYYVPLLEIITGCAGGGAIDSSGWGELHNLIWFAGKLTGYNFSTDKSSKLKSIQLGENIYPSAIAAIHLKTLSKKITFPNVTGNVPISISAEYTVYFGQNWYIDQDGGIYKDNTCKFLLGMYPSRAAGKTYVVPDTVEYLYLDCGYSSTTKMESWDKLIIPSSVSLWRVSTLNIYNFSGSEIEIDGSSFSPNGISINISHCARLKKFTLKNFKINSLTIISNSYVPVIDCSITNCTVQSYATLSLSTTMYIDRLILPVGFTSGYIYPTLNYLKVPPSYTTCPNIQKAKVIDFTAYQSILQLPSISYLGNIPTFFPNYKIIVPDALYDTWITSTNWSNSTIRSHIIKESEYNE